MARANSRAAVARAYQQALPPLAAGGQTPAVKRAVKKISNLQPKLGVAPKKRY